MIILEIFDLLSELDTCVKTGSQIPVRMEYTLFQNFARKIPRNQAEERNLAAGPERLRSPIFEAKA